MVERQFDRKRFWTIALLCLAWVGFSDRAYSQTVEHRFTAVLLGESEDAQVVQRLVREALEEATDLLAVAHSATDVPCDIRLGLEGDIQVQAVTAPGRTTSACDRTSAISDKDSEKCILDKPQFLKLVDEISYCEGIRQAFGGCARLAAGSMAVDWRAADHDGLLGETIAHEFGHTRGLDHYTSPSGMVMNATIKPESRELTKDECNSFRLRQPYDTSELMTVRR